MRQILLLSALPGVFFLPLPGKVQPPGRTGAGGKDLKAILAGHARDLMDALEGRIRALPGGDPKLESRLEAIQRGFLEKLRTWRKAHPGSPDLPRALFEEGKTWWSLGEDEKACSALEALTPRGLTPEQRLLAAQWLVLLSRPSQALSLVRGLEKEDLSSFRERLLLAAILSLAPGNEKDVLALLGLPSGEESREGRAEEFRKGAARLERALPGLPAPLARSLEALLWREELSLLPSSSPEAARLRTLLDALALKPGDPLPRAASKALEGLRKEGTPFLLLFFQARAPLSLQVLSQTSRLLSKLREKGEDLSWRAVSLDKRRRDLEKIRGKIPKGVPVLHDGRGWEGPLARAFAVDRVPYTVLVGRDGRILALGLTGRMLSRKIEEIAGGD